MTDIKIVSIEGNIGAGKSTLLKALEEDDRFVVLYEYVDDWHDALKHFYKDKEKYSLTLQLKILESRFKAVINVMNEMLSMPDKILICERGLHADLMVFAKALVRSKYMNDIEFETYKGWHDFVMSVTNLKFHKHVYLKVDTDICLERIKKRGRDGEEDIDQAYLDILEEAHDEWLGAIDNVLVIDANGSVDYEDLKNALTA